MSGRQEGSLCDRFDPEALCHDLEPLASLEKPPCDFEMERYGKTKKGQSADRDAMDEYYPLLKIVLAHARRGLPIKSGMKLTWQELVGKHDIISARSKQLYTQEEWVDRAIDRVGLVCRQLRDLAKSKTVYVTSKVRELMEMVDIGDVPPLPAATDSKSKVDARRATKQIVQ